MNPIVGSPSSLRGQAQTWAFAAQIDSAAVTDVLTAAVRTSAAMPGATGTQALCAAISAPSGSLEGAGRVLTSACGVLSTYATELENQQRLWTEAEAAHVRADRSAATLYEDIDPRGRVPHQRSAQWEAVEAQRTGARSDQADAVAAADLATATAVQALADLATQLELLGVRTVLAGGSPTAAPSVPGLGSVTPEQSYTPLITSMQLPQREPPAQRAQWFQGLTEAEQRSLIATDPSFVGQADGLPAWARDEANRILLERHLGQQDAVLASLGLDRSAVATKEGADDVASQLRVLQWTEAEIAAALSVWSVHRQVREEESSSPDRSVQLYLYEPEVYQGQGRAAISLGDLDSAANVTVLVPGMTSDLPNYLDTQVSAGVAVADQADREGLDTAVLAYVGYDAPGRELAVLVPFMAREGAAQLASDVVGLRASRGADAPWLTGVGHSYGGVVLSNALAEHGLELDAVILAQAPGTGSANTVHDFTGVDPSRVFVLSESDDPVPYLGQILGTLGADPASTEFGATRLLAETDALLFGAHSSMFTVGGWPLHNITKVTGNQIEQVRTAPRRITAPTLPSALPNLLPFLDPAWGLPNTVPGTPIPGPDPRPVDVPAVQGGTDTKVGPDPDLPPPDLGIYIPDVEHHDPGIYAPATEPHHDPGIYAPGS